MDPVPGELSEELPDPPPHEETTIRKMEAKECQNLFLFFILTSAILVDPPITQSCPNLVLRSRSFQRYVINWFRPRNQFHKQRKTRKIIFIAYSVSYYNSFPESLIRNQICCQEKKTPKSPLWLSPAEHTQLSLQVFGIPAISYKVEIEWHYLRPKENHSPTLTLPPEEFGEGRFLRLNVSI
jgi:hypothetical protein